jgi:hypothetical protein
MSMRKFEVRYQDGCFEARLTSRIEAALARRCESRLLRRTL